jgi:protein TonB
MFTCHGLPRLIQEVVIPDSQSKHRAILEEMFTLTEPRSSQPRPRLATWCSVAAHGLLLLWLLHPPSPKLIAPSFVVHGDHGTYIAHIFWPNQAAATTSSPGTSAADSRQQLNARQAWKRRAKAAKKEAERELPRPKIGLNDQTSAPGEATQAHAAGSPLGTVLEGPLSGEEVRPALPVVSPDPHVAADELGGLQGDVVVEVTIDDKGNIVQKVVVESLTPAIDNKVLEALENWRFRPATRNGVAIASKQDVYYHFPRLGKG